MKRIWLVLTCVTVVLGMAACKKESGPEPRPAGPDYFIEKTASKDISLADFKQLLGVEYPELAEVLDGVPSKKIRVDAITYHTISPQGDPVVASGVVSYPLDIDINGVTVAEHGTIFTDADAPTSMMFQPEVALSLLGNAVVMPDYIGFGASVALPHPYLHVANTGRVTVDMLFAAREYMTTINKPIDGTISVVGYSQGGHSALAFEQVAEAQYADKIQITTVYAGGGPYDLVGSYDKFVADDFTGYPCSIPYIAMGLDYGDNLKLDYTKVFIDPLLSNYEKWFDKSYNEVYIIGFMGTYSLSGFMHPDLFTAGRNAELNKLYASMKKNSLLDWKPKAKVKLYHAVNDSVVPFLNALNAYKAFDGTGVSLTYINEGDHLEGLVEFYKQVFIDYIGFPQ